MKLQSDGKPFVPNPHGFQHTRVLQLLCHQLLVKEFSGLQSVGFDAPHEMGLALHELLRERRQRVLQRQRGVHLETRLSLGVFS